MQRLLLILALSLFAAGSGAQDTETGAEEEAPAATEAGTPADDVTDQDVEELLGVDDDYRNAEEEFDPTEEVRFEQNILFPTDI